MRMTGKNRELRIYPLDVAEVRADDDTDGLHFTGHAAVFDELSVDLGGFREKIAPGAFKKTLREAPDVRFLIGHEPDKVLARTKSGTLRLSEDKTGLAVDADLAPTTYAKDLGVLLRRGDVDQMSFGFWTITDSWEKAEGDAIRTLEEVSLHDGDVSVVTYPAYPQTTAEVRDVAARVLYEVPSGVLPGDIREILEAVLNMDELGDLDLARLAINALRSELDDYFRPDPDPVSQDGEGSAARRRRLSIIEKQASI